MKQIINQKDFISAKEASGDCIDKGMLVVLITLDRKDIYFLEKGGRKYTWKWVFTTGVDYSWGRYDSIEEAILSAVEEHNHVYLFNSMTELMRNIYKIGVRERV